MNEPSMRTGRRKARSVVGKQVEACVNVGDFKFIPVDETSSTKSLHTPKGIGALVHQMCRKGRGRGKFTTRIVEENGVKGVRIYRTELGEA